MENELKREKKLDTQRGRGSSMGSGRDACLGEKGGDLMYVLEVESSGLADELAQGRRKTEGREKNHMWLLDFGL